MCKMANVVIRVEKDAAVVTGQIGDGKKEYARIDKSRETLYVGQSLVAVALQRWFEISGLLKFHSSNSFMSREAIEGYLRGALGWQFASSVIEKDGAQEVRYTFGV